MGKNAEKGKTLPIHNWLFLGLALIASIFLPFIYPPKKKSFATVITRPDFSDNLFRSISFISFLIVLSVVAYFIRRSLDETFPLKLLPALTLLIIVFIIAGANLKGGMAADASEQILPGIIWFIGPFLLLSPIWIVSVVMLFKAKITTPTIPMSTE